MSESNDDDDRRDMIRRRHRGENGDNDDNTPVTTITRRRVVRRRWRAAGFLTERTGGQGRRQSIKSYRDGPGKTICSPFQVLKTIKSSFVYCAIDSMYL